LEEQQDGVQAAFSIGSRKGIWVQALTAPFKKDFWGYDPMADAWTQISDSEELAEKVQSDFQLATKGM
jgi:hypothetical protein